MFSGIPVYDLSVRSWQQHGYGPGAPSQVARLPDRGRVAVANAAFPTRPALIFTNSQMINRIPRRVKGGEFDHLLDSPVVPDSSGSLSDPSDLGGRGRLGSLGDFGNFDGFGGFDAGAHSVVRDGVPGGGAGDDTPPVAPGPPETPGSPDLPGSAAPS